MLKVKEQEDDGGNNLNKALIDGFGRVARKLRLSVTDRCNMQCIYCMPRNMDKNDKTRSSDEPIAKKDGGLPKMRS